MYNSDLKTTLKQHIKNCKLYIYGNLFFNTAFNYLTVSQGFLHFKYNKNNKKLVNCTFKCAFEMEVDSIRPRKRINCCTNQIAVE